ncbi:hypothetical protein TanjilG_29956 [Lupinus angustifolius]|uniref:BHLH domain-containing protein n=1 Tax=Lupinus angustifolius TaxID=3871 RepID=A0A1J7H0Y4_LUPAN|nr:hypothetical protein TanjilG_29956 [Lupinus angustifolius]
MSIMNLNTKHSYKLYVKKATRIIRKQQQQRRRRRRRSFKPMKFKLSQKLQELNNLIIPSHSGDIVKLDQLFKETADYIVLLRTRVVVMQKLIEFYGNNHENENAILL